MNREQLVTGGCNSERRNIYPITVLENVLDKKSGMNAGELIESVNHIYINVFKNDVLSARKRIPIRFRKTGLWITRLNDKNRPVTEYYIGEGYSDKEWINNDNWRLYENNSSGGSAEKEPLIINLVKSDNSFSSDTTTFRQLDAAFREDRPIRITGLDIYEDGLEYIEVTGHSKEAIVGIQIDDIINVKFTIYTANNAIFKCEKDASDGEFINDVYLHADIFTGGESAKTFTRDELKNYPKLDANGKVAESVIPDNIKTKIPDLLQRFADDIPYDWVLCYNTAAQAESGSGGSITPLLDIGGGTVVPADPSVLNVVGKYCKLNTIKEGNVYWFKHQLVGSTSSNSESISAYVVSVSPEIVLLDINQTAYYRIKKVNDTVGQIENYTDYNPIRKTDVGTIVPSLVNGKVPLKQLPYHTNLATTGFTDNLKNYPIKLYHSYVTSGETDYIAITANISVMEESILESTNRLVDEKGLKSLVGIGNGLASLDSSGKIPDSQLPDSTITLTKLNEFLTKLQEANPNLIIPEL